MQTLSNIRRIVVGCVLFALASTALGQGQASLDSQGIDAYGQGGKLIGPAQGNSFS